VYKWELDKGDQSLEITVNGSLILDELDLVIQAAIDGAGLAWVAEDRVAAHLASGTLVRVLEDWCPPFPGFFLYYPSRKQQPAALAAVIETFRL
jgi:DNA-binding transcriptional LysR family regulator